MADIVKIKKALDYASKNFDNEDDDTAREKSYQFTQKFGLDESDLEQYRTALVEPNPETNKVQASVIDKVANYGNSPVQGTERFAIKNLIDEDPDLQIEYLKRKGYEARINGNGELEAAKPGDLFRPVDPSQFELNDLFDVVGDGIQTVVDGVMTGTKALGLIGAPATGGASIAASSGLGGAVSGGMEATKQTLARLAGLRDNYDPARVVEKAAIGSTFPLIPHVAGKLFKSAAEAWKPTLKKNAPEIIAAAEKMGASPTLGQLSDNINVQKLEDARASAPETVFGIPFNRDIQQQIAKNKEATDTYAESLLSGRTPMTRVQAGREIQKEVGAKLTSKLGASERLYDEIGRKLDLPGYTVNTRPIGKVLDVLEQDLQFDEIGLNWVAKKREQLDRIGTVGDLRKFSRSLSNDAQRYSKSDPTLAGAAKTVNNRSKVLVDETFNDILNQWESNLQGTDPIKSKEFLDHIAGLRSNLKEANRLYREVNVEADAVLKRPTESTKGSAASKISNINDQSFSKTFDSVLAKGDVKKAEWMAQNYPEETSIARGTRLNEIFTKARQTRTKSFASAVNQQIKALKPEEREILLGKDGIEKADALATYFGELGMDSNPSKSGKGVGFFQPKLLGDLTVQSLNFMRYQLAKMPRTGKGISGIGKALDNPVTRGSAYQAANQLLIPMTKKDSNDNLLSP
jgi:hypothetical protein